MPIRKPINFIRKPVRFSGREEVEKAGHVLEKAAALDSGFSALHLLRADMFHKQGDRVEEMKAIEKALSIDSLKGYAYYFMVLADGYFDRGDYERAQGFYRLYLERDRRLTGAAQVRKRLEDCAFALKALKARCAVKLELYLQSEHPVYWPSLDVAGKTLLYTEQTGDREMMWMLRDSVRYPLDFYPEGRCGAPSLTADGRMMYFTRDGGRGRSDIYVAYRLSDSTWTAPISLGNLSIRTVGKPSLLFLPMVPGCFSLQPGKGDAEEAIFGTRACCVGNRMENNIGRNRNACISILRGMKWLFLIFRQSNFVFFFRRLSRNGTEGYL